MTAVTPPKIDELDRQTIEQIKKELLDRKRQIKQDLNDLTDKGKSKVKESSVKFPDFGEKTDENAQEIGEYSTNLAMERVLKNTLRDIENALDRIEKGTYGFCRYCGKAIGKKRLLARPVANTCIECKTKLQSAV